MEKYKKLHIAIIGAGIAGLITAKQLQADGHQCTIFEKIDRIGGVWAYGYEGQGLQIPKQFYEFPGYPMPANFPLFPSAINLREYIGNYAQKFDLYKIIRFNATVTELAEKDKSWRVHYADKDGPHIESFDFVVICIGIFSNPKIPTIPNQEKFKGKILHSSQVKNIQRFRKDRITVVGYGKSALDIAAYMAKNNDHQITLLHRGPKWVGPMKYLGIIPVEYLIANRAGLCLMPPYINASPAGKWEKYWAIFYKFVWKMQEYYVRAFYQLKKLNVLPKGQFQYDFLETPEFFSLLSKHKIVAEHAGIKEFSEDGRQVILTNGKRLDMDVVVMATGWDPDYSILPPAFVKSVKQDTDEENCYLYRHMVYPDLPNCAFVGILHTLYTSLTIHMQVLWLSALLKGELVLPDKEDMKKEIEELKRWKKEIFKNVQGRCYSLQLHMFSYHDELLKDLGINHHRKSNAVKNFLAPIKPSDYSDLFS